MDTSTNGSKRAWRSFREIAGALSVWAWKIRYERAERIYWPEGRHKCK